MMEDGKFFYPSVKRERDVSMLIYVVVFVVTCVSFAVVLINNSIYHGPQMATDAAPGSWSYYKHTVSVTTGKFHEVSEFVQTYITNIRKVENLGCNTVKVVGLLAAPHNDNAFYGFTEIHWVDSNVFTQVGPSIGNWSDYIESMNDNYNAFMHNKVQMYVPDILPHFSKINGDGVTALYRLSTSSLGTHNDTAHILVNVPNSGHYYEIVGPSSSLGSEELNYFSEWQDEECPTSHTLVSSLEYYYGLYMTAASSQAQKKWTELTGLYVPMGVGIMMPTSSFDTIDDTLTIISSISDARITYSKSSPSTEGCSYVDIALTSDTHFEPNVRYVVNSRTNQGSDYSVGDWERYIQETHRDLIDDSATYLGWDRYMDTHIGILPFYENATVCLIDEALIEDGLAAAQNYPRYSTRKSEGIHYYVGTQGLKSWEFNAILCDSPGVTDLCGCLESNNNDEYYSINGENCPHTD
jgi:hypothetical protein